MEGYREASVGLSRKWLQSNRACCSRRRRRYLNFEQWEKISSDCKKFKRSKGRVAKRFSLSAFNHRIVEITEMLVSRDSIAHQVHPQIYYPQQIRSALALSG